MGHPSLVQEHLEDKPVSADEMRLKIMALERAISEQPEAFDSAGIDSITFHHFAPGVYMRELRIPKGMLLTGMIHKTEHLNIFVGGDLSVWTDSGMRRLNKHEVIVSKPGIKRVGYAHDDSVWITVHPNVDNLTDVKALEDILVTDSFESLNAKEAVKELAEGDK